MPPMPIDMDDKHTRIPTSPYDIDPRDLRDPRTMSGPFDSRMEGPDYFYESFWRSITVPTARI